MHTWSQGLMDGGLLAAVWMDRRHTDSFLVPRQYRWSWRRQLDDQLAHAWCSGTEPWWSTVPQHKALDEGGGDGTASLDGAPQHALGHDRAATASSRQRWRTALGHGEIDDVGGGLPTGSRAKGCRCKTDFKETVMWMDIAPYWAWSERA
jgi:hypothetical protein